MSKQQPTSFEATASVLQRLGLAVAEQPDGITGLADGTEPASNSAVIFAAIIQARAIDRLTKAVERCADVIGNPGVKK